MASSVKGLRKWDMVLVKWEDADFDSEPAHSDELDAAPVMRLTVGFLVKKERQRITLAATDDRLSEEQLGTDCQDLNRIPIGMIRNVWKLQRAR